MSIAELPSSLRKILELFEETGAEELDVDTVARHLKLKRSTIKKYMDQLAKLGYLVKKYTNVYALARKPAEEKQEEKAAAEAKPAERQEQPAQPVEQAGEEIRREALEVKPTAEVVETFYFYVRGAVVPLRVSSLEQLAAVLKYKLVEPEELAYAVRTGFLQTWIERSLHDSDLARKLDELRGLSDQELFNEVSKLVFEKAKLC